MDEIDALRGMRTALAEPESPERLARRVRWNQAEPARRPLRRRRAWLAPVTGLATAAAVTATAVAVLSSGGTAPATSPPPPPPPTRLDDALLVAATHADAGGTGAYWYVHRLEGTVFDIGRSRADHYRVELISDYTTWRSSTGGEGCVGPGDVAARPLTPSDDAKWRAAGAPKEIPADTPDGPTALMMRDLEPSDTRKVMCGTDTTFYGLTPAQVNALPAEPAALRARLLRLKEHWRVVTADGSAKEPLSALHGADQALALSNVLGDLLSMVPAPPKVRGAAFRLMATLPGVTAEGTAADPLGRTGALISLPISSTTAIGIYTAPRQLGTYRRQWIIDPASGVLLAVRNLTERPPGGSRPLPPSDSGEQRRLTAGSQPDRFHVKGELASYTTFEKTDWTDTLPTAS